MTTTTTTIIIMIITILTLVNYGLRDDRRNHSRESTICVRQKCLKAQPYDTQIYLVRRLHSR